MALRTLSFLLLLNLAARAQTIAYGDNKAAGHYVNPRGIRLYYESYGKGDPLLLFHMNGESIKVFYNQIPYFSRYYHVIAVDSRAHGRSTDPADSLSFEQMADDFNALCDSLHLDSCYVIGWADGGTSALFLAFRHPDKGKKTIVSEPDLLPNTTPRAPYQFHYIDRKPRTL